MTTFQWLAIPSLFALAALTLLGVGRRRLGFRVRLAWTLLWLASATAIAFPEALVHIARAVGIARGADLVMYVSILFMFVAFFLVYLRFRKLESQVTLLVRHLAIREAGEEPDDTGR